jgi:hypothetical protein
VRIAPLVPKALSDQSGGMWSNNVDHPDAIAPQVKLRLLVEFFVWLLTAPLSERNA